MNYIQELKDILTSEYSNTTRKQQKLDDLARNSYPTRIHPNSQSTFDLLKRKVKDKIKQLESKLQHASGEDRKDLEARLKELKDAQKEFKKIEQSSTMYSFRIQQEPEFDYSGFLDEGTVFYDGTLRSLINELKHVFQFESGQLEFIGVGGKSLPGLTYDIYDELATYKRQYAFDGVLNLTIALTEEEIVNGITTIENKDIGRVVIKKMKDIKVAVIAKISDNSVKDGLYQNISQRELNIHSSAKDVFNANKENRFDRVLNISLGSADKKKPYLEYIKVYIKQKPIIYAKY